MPSSAKRAKVIIDGSEFVTTATKPVIAPAQVKPKIESVDVEPVQVKPQVETVKPKN